MAVWDARAQALALRHPAAQARHFGVQPGLVNEDQPLRVQVRLGVEPGLARRGNVRAVLLAAMGGLLWNGPSLPPVHNYALGALRKEGADR